MWWRAFKRPWASLATWDSSDCRGDGEACTGLGRCVRCGSGARALLATGGDDRTVRLWDLVDGRCVVTVPVHLAVMTITSVADSLAVGLDAGLLVIKFEADFLAQGTPRKAGYPAQYRSS